MHVTLDGRHDDLTGRRTVLEARGLLFRLQIRLQIRHGLLHHAGALHHLRQEHLAGAEQVADHVHAVHQRALDHIERLGELLARFFRVGINELCNPVDQTVRKAFLDRPVAPLEILLDLLRAIALEARRRV